MTAPAPVTAILLSTFNGAAFLPAQLDSFAAQEGVDWHLFWRDDGSDDASAALVRAFAARTGRATEVGPPTHRGVTGSYLALLRAAVTAGAGSVAFADQDDVWLPGKLRRGLDQLGPAHGPALYCSRQVLVDAKLHPLGGSAPVRVVLPGIGPALTQNIATGCTVILNRPGAELVADSEPPAPSLHDWWSYLVVSAAGGRVVADPEPTVLYRQHGRNAVGAPQSRRRRALAALRRGPGAFMHVMRAQVLALEAQPHLLSPEARPVVRDVAAALCGTTTRRVLALWRHPLRRQTAAETWLFRLWFLLG